tara:strand:- start:659 stop:1813 length:1155 start_codon:yes stop_codon:yes gene_type:complete
MNITLKRTNEQLELVQAMASKNRDVAYEAQVALAEFIGPVINEVVNNAPTLSNLFTPLQFNADDNPSIPLDVYYDVADEDYINVYSSHAPGGLPTNQVTPSHNEVKLATYKLDTAVSFDKKYASRSRMDVVSKSFTRAAQEILLKQERTSGNLLLGALANASTTIDGATKKHTFASNQAGRFLLDDLNALLTLAKRIRPSFAGGTPVAGSAGITDLIVSPETVEDLREMAYNPINTRDADGAAAATGDNMVAAPDSVRAGMYTSAGIPEFYGVSVMEIHELGPNKKFTKIFAGLAGSAQMDDNPNGGDSAFDHGDADDLVIGIDRSRDAFVRAIAVDSETGSEFSLVADDQYSVRQQKIGYYGSIEEGRVVLDDRAIVGVAIDL